MLQPRPRRRRPRWLASQARHPSPTHVPAVIAVVVACAVAVAWQPDADPQPEKTTREEAQPAAQREVRVRLTDGRVLEGLLVRETDRVVTVRIGPLDSTVPVEQVEEVVTLPPIEARYRELRGKLSDEDVPGRIMLTEWLRDRGAYTLGLTEIRGVLAIEPFNPRANDLEKWLRLQVELEAKRREREAARGDDEDDEGEREPRRRVIDDFPVLNPDEINLIRVFEVDLTDPPRLIVPRGVVQRFVEAYTDHDLMPPTQAGRDAILRKHDTAVLDLMFRTRAREFYPEVKVIEDPESLRLFRQEVHGRWLINSCAAVACHGGQEAGRLYLNRERANSDATVYTNFLILERFKLADGSPLIDYENPSSSPLLQMTLPRDLSTSPHPEVARRRGLRGFNHIFRSEQDFRFRKAVEWINEMYRPRPEYPVEYDPPIPRGVRDLDDKPVDR